MKVTVQVDVTTVQYYQCRLKVVRFQSLLSKMSYTVCIKMHPGIFERCSRFKRIVTLEKLAIISVIFDVVRPVFKRTIIMYLLIHLKTYLVHISEFKLITKHILISWSIQYISLITFTVFQFMILGAQVLSAEFIIHLFITIKQCRPMLSLLILYGQSVHVVVGPIVRAQLWSAHETTALIHCNILLHSFIVIYFCTHSL